MPRAFEKLRGIISGFRNAEGLSRNDSDPFEPFALGELIVTCQVSWPIDRSKWESLFCRVPTATVFQSPLWQIESWTAGQIRGRLRFLQVWRDEALLAVLPLCLNDGGGLHSPGASISDYLDPLIEPTEEAACWRAILAFIDSHWDRKMVEFTLHNLREVAPCRALLPVIAAEAGLELREQEVEHAPAIELRTTWDAYLDSLDGHERKELRRKLNKAETRGNARLTKITETTEVADYLAKALSMMEAAGGEKAAAVAGYIGPLLRATANGLVQTGRLNLYALHLHDRLACCLIQFPTKSGVMLYNIGYDAALKEWSPGVVTVAMTIRQAIARGDQIYDLLRGREAYKYKLGAKDRPLFKVTVKKRENEAKNT